MLINYNRLYVIVRFNKLHGEIPMWTIGIADFVIYSK